MMHKKNSPTIPGKLSPGAWILLLLLPPIVSLIALCVGRMQISPSELMESISAHLFSGETVLQVERVLWNMRLPRIFLALLVGGGLSAAGCAFQSLFSNPLATPDTLGVASGASFGAALGLLLGFDLIGVQLTALLFGAAAIAVTFLSARGGGLNQVVLGGIMVGSLFSALVSFVKFTADTESQLPAITYWLMGSLGNAGYRQLALGAPLILVGIVILLLLRWRLNLLPLSEDEAASMGIRIKALRLVTVLCATAITAACVSMCGQVGWVGLLVPHFCRMLFGNNHLSLLPASVLVGGAFMVTVDTIARSVTASELPISILTAIIGAPFFIWLLRRRGGWRL